MLTKDLTVEIEMISPKLAEEYLLKNTSNRKLRLGTVETYARDMAEGRWEVTHQGIAFNKEGELIDGQHRLSAIVLSKRSQKMVVTRNVNSRINVDNHIRRNLVDTTGYSAWHIAIANVILGRLKRTNSRASSSELKSWIDSHIENLDFAIDLMKTNKQGLRLSAIKAAVFAASYTEPLERLEEFADVFKTGKYDNYEEDNAAIRLREWLMTGDLLTKHIVKLAYSKTEAAVKAFCERREVKRLQASDQVLYEVK